MGSKFRTSIKMSGPFFQRDPGKTFRENAHDMMKAIAREGAADVKGAMAVGNAGRAPIRELGTHVSDHVTGELRRRPAGSGYTAMIFVRNKEFSAKEGKSLMAAASSVEGRVHAFRKTKGRISRSRRVNVDELVKGIA